MRVKVRFKFNVATGEVEEFLVRDLEPGRRAPDHDDEHDRIAAEIGAVVDPYPGVDELIPERGSGGGTARSGRVVAEHTDEVREVAEDV